MLDQVNYNLSGLSDQTVTRLNELADFMEADKVYGFYMPTVYENMTAEAAKREKVEFCTEHYCGTAGCIAGYVLFIIKQYPAPTYMATRWLGISPTLGESLFFAYDSAPIKSHHLDSITRAVAVKAVRILASTGEVNFTRAKQEVAEEIRV